MLQPCICYDEQRLSLLGRLHWRIRRLLCLALVCRPVRHVSVMAVLSRDSRRCEHPCLALSGMVRHLLVGNRAGNSVDGAFALGVRRVSLEVRLWCHGPPGGQGFVHRPFWCGPVATALRMNERARLVRVCEGDSLFSPFCLMFVVQEGCSSPVQVEPPQLSPSLAVGITIAVVVRLCFSLPV